MPDALITFTLGTAPADGLASVPASRIRSIVRTARNRAVVKTDTETFETTTPHDELMGSYRAATKRRWF